MRLQDINAINNMRLKGYSVSTISKVLELPYSTVKSHIHRHPEIPGASVCRTPHLYDSDIQRLFLAAVSKLFAERETILETCRLMQSTLTDNTAIDSECEEILREMDVVAGLIRCCVEENAALAVDQTDYQARYTGYVNRYESLKNRYAQLQLQREEREAEAIRIGGFMFELRELEELPIAFDEKLWHELVDHVTVYADERLVFRFKDGSEIAEQL